MRLRGQGSVIVHAIMERGRTINRRRNVVLKKPEGGQHGGQCRIWILDNDKDAGEQGWHQQRELLSSRNRYQLNGHLLRHRKLSTLLDCFGNNQAKSVKGGFERSQ